MTDRETVPSPVEQAKEAARDDLDLSELCDLFRAVGQVYHIAVFNDDDDPTRETFVEIAFDDDNGRGTADAISIARRAGWTVDEVVWCRNWLRFSQEDDAR